jgi:hypothetical protein
LNGNTYFSDESALVADTLYVIEDFQGNVTLSILLHRQKCSTTASFPDEFSLDVVLNLDKMFRKTRP